MEGTLLQLPEGMQIEQIQLTENGFVIEAAATTSTSCCPLCSQASSSVHCHYCRILRDVPCAGRPVQLRLTVRKFTCRNPYCQRKVFAKRLPDFVEPFARMTLRYGQQITSIGLATCAKEEPDSQPVWEYERLGRRSCAASRLCLISLPNRSSFLA